MTIKDVEKITGLTAKSIRLYEQKELIQVNRDSNNDYRTYSEENIKQLKLIKLYRYLGFSIEEIKELLSLNNEELTACLREKYQSFNAHIDDVECKKDVVNSLLSEIDNIDFIIDDYLEEISFVEQDTYKESMTLIRYLRIPSLTTCWWITLIAAGPVGMLFINILNNSYSKLLINAIFAIFAVVMATSIWHNYFIAKRSYAEEIREVNKNDAPILPLALLTILFVIGLSCIGAHTFETFIVPEDWLFYEVNEVALKIMLPLLVLTVLGGIYLVRQLIRDESTRASKYLLKFAGLLILVIFILYGCLTNVTIVTEDRIISCTPLNPTGTEYSYSDVDKINAGFTNKGNFRYTISLDNKKIAFSTPSCNGEIERFNESTYLELEEFDKALMSLNLEKVSDTNNSHLCSLDDEYVDRFIRIIENR